MRRPRTRRAAHAHAATEPPPLPPADDPAHTRVSIDMPIGIGIYVRTCVLHAACACKTPPTVALQWSGVTCHTGALFTVNINDTSPRHEGTRSRPGVIPTQDPHLARKRTKQPGTLYFLMASALEASADPSASKSISSTGAVFVLAATACTSPLSASLPWCCTF